MPKILDEDSEIALSDVEPSQRFVPQDDDDEVLYEVLEITSEKRGLYKVKWAGEDPKTGKPWPQSWVKKTDCTDDLVIAWKTKKLEKQRRKSRKSTTSRRDSTTSTKRGPRASVASTSKSRRESTSLRSNSLTTTAKVKKPVIRNSPTPIPEDDDDEDQVAFVKNEVLSPPMSKSKDNGSSATVKKGKKRKRQEAQSANSSTNHGQRAGTVDVEADEDEDDTATTTTKMKKTPNREVTSSRPQKKRKIFIDIDIGNEGGSGDNDDESEDARTVEQALSPPRPKAKPTTRNPPPSIANPKPDTNGKRVSLASRSSSRIHTPPLAEPSVMYDGPRSPTLSPATLLRLEEFDRDILEIQLEDAGAPQIPQASRQIDDGEIVPETDESQEAIPPTKFVSLSPGKPTLRSRMKPRTPTLSRVDSSAAVDGSKPLKPIPVLSPSAFLPIFALEAQHLNTADEEDSIQDVTSSNPHKANGAAVDEDDMPMSSIEQWDSPEKQRVNGHPLRGAASGKAKMLDLELEKRIEKARGSAEAIWNSDINRRGRELAEAARATTSEKGKSKISVDDIIRNTKEQRERSASVPEPILTFDDQDAGVEDCGNASEDQEEVADASTNVVPSLSGPPAPLIPSQEEFAPSQGEQEPEFEPLDDGNDELDADLDASPTGYTQAYVDHSIDLYQSLPEYGIRDEADMGMDMDQREEEEESTQDLVAERMAIEAQPRREIDLNSGWDFGGAGVASEPEVQVPQIVEPEPELPAPTPAPTPFLAPPTLDMEDTGSELGVPEITILQPSRAASVRSASVESERVGPLTRARSRSRSQTPSVTGSRRGKGKKAKILKIPSPVPSREPSPEVESHPLPEPPNHSQLEPQTPSQVEPQNHSQFEPPSQSEPHIHSQSEPESHPQSESHSQSQVEYHTQSQQVEPQYTSQPESQPQPVIMLQSNTSYPPANGMPFQVNDSQAELLAEREKRVALELTLDALRNQLAQAQQRHSVIGEEQLASLKAQWEAESAQKDAQILQLQSSAASLEKAKASAEKEIDFFRDQYREASGYAGRIREENKELEEQARIAKDQASKGVALIRSTFEERINFLERDTKSWRQMAEFLIEKDKRSGGDELRRRAAEAPELHNRLRRLGDDLEIAELKIETLETELADKAEQEERLQVALVHLEQWKGQATALTLDLNEALTKLERLGTGGSQPSQPGDNGHEFVYRCLWRPTDTSRGCSEVFLTMREFEQHMLSGAHPAIPSTYVD